MQSEKIDQIIAEIKRTMQRPGSRPLTSAQLRAREDYRHSLATGAKVLHIAVTEAYR